MLVKRRTILGTVIVGGAGLALAYLYYGKNGLPDIIPKATTTITPGKLTTTTTPISTTTMVTEIPTTITPPQKPENMLTPYLIPGCRI